MGNTNTTWRTLIHFVVREYDKWYVGLPAWGHHAIIGIEDADIPDFVRNKIEPNMRCYAHANLGEDNPYDLFFEKWELGPECECGGVVFGCRPPEYDQMYCTKCDRTLSDLRK